MIELSERDYEDYIDLNMNKVSPEVNERTKNI